MNVRERQGTWMRLFIALPLPEAVIHAIAVWCKQGKEHGSLAKWVHPLDLHITLQFLGEVEEESVARIAEALEQVSRETTSFHLHLEGIGVFGTKEVPRVLWAGIGGQIDMLRQLNQRVTTATAALGFEPELHPYRPHITLARKYRKRHEEPFSGIDEPLPPHSWTCGEMALFRSHLHKSPMYERLHTFTLG